MTSELITCLEQVKSGQPVEFEQTLSVINQNYDYTPACFYNGIGEDRLVNPPGNNEGSCRIFHFALLQKLTEQETLALFGKYYREDVLLNPDGKDHANIRNFMKYGWPGIVFETPPLSLR